jgi:carbamoyl-phosphate synthase large subunit
MGKKINILVLGVSGNVSIGILKALKNSSISGIYTYGACIYKNSAGFAMSDQALICPLAFSDTFVDWLTKTVDSYAIDVVLSGVEEVNYVLSKLPNKDSGPLYLVPEFHNVEIFYDKWLTVNWLKDHGIDHPNTINLDETKDINALKNELGIPFIVKPRIGKGSKGVSVIDEQDDVSKYLTEGGYIAQQLVGNAQTEYTCGVYKSKFGYTEVIAMRRILSNGSTSVAEVVFDEEIENYCKKIAENLDTTSPFNVQLRVCDKTGKPLCFEINMRLSGTTSIRHKFGFKDCEAWLQEMYFNHDSRDLFKVASGVAIRYEEEIYFKGKSLDFLNKENAIDVQKELIK